MNRNLPMSLFSLSLLCITAPLVHGRLDLSASPLELKNDTRRDFIDRTLQDHFKHCPFFKKDAACNISYYDPIPSNVTDCNLCSSCKCDDRCAVYGDCCPDIALTRQVDFNRFACSAAVVYHFSLSKPVNYFMIASCPDNHQNDSSCAVNPPFKAELLSFQPVTNRKKSIVYRNLPCARCHGEQLENLVHWKAVAVCKGFDPAKLTSNEMIFKAVEERVCSIQFEPPREDDARTCHFSSGIIDKCNVTGLWEKYDQYVDQACRSYRVVYRFKYQNVFCYMCNLGRPRRCHLKNLVVNTYLGSIPFSAVLNFYPNTDDIPSKTDELLNGADTEEGKNGTCEVGSIYDVFKQNCRKLHCHIGKILQGDRCYSIINDIQSVSYYAAVSLQPKNKKTEEEFWRNLGDFPNLMKETFFGKIDSVRINVVADMVPSCGRKEKCNGEDKLLLTLDRLLALILFEVYTKQSKDTFENLMVDLILSMEEVQNSSFQYATRFVDEADILKQLYDAVDDTRANLPKREVFSFPLMNDQISKTTILQSLKVSPFLVCAAIVLHINETGFTFAGNSLILPQIGADFDSGEFEVVSDGRVKICADNYLRRAQHSLGNLKDGPKRHESSVLATVSFVFSVLALAFLAVTILTYCVFPQLRSLPGKNNMGLVTTEIIAQCLFVFGSGQTSLGWGCVLIGVLLHFSLFSSILWMNVCSFHMYRAFSGLGSVHEQPNRFKAIIQYIVYVVGGAAAMVALAILVNYFSSEGATTGYGGEICYLSSTFSIGLFFALPLGLVLVSNMVFFLLTIRVFWNMPKIDGRTSRDRENVYIYAKLSTITGIHWVFGFLAEGLQLEFLEYAFVILNGLQGAFIFFSFICNRRVLQLWKKACGLGTDVETSRTSVTGLKPAGSSTNDDPGNVVLGNLGSQQ